MLDHELASVFGDSTNRAASAFEEQAQRLLADREAVLTRREHEIEVRECRLEAAITRSRTIERI